MAKTFSEYLANKKKQEETEGSQQKTFSDYKAQRDLGTNFGGDVESVNNAITSMRSEWQDATTMSANRSALADIANRVTTARNYVANNRDMFSDTSEYEKALGDLDALSSQYSNALKEVDTYQNIYRHYKNAEEYKAKLEKAKEKQANDNTSKYDAMSYDELVKEKDALESQKTAPAWVSIFFSALTPSQQRSEKFKSDAEAAYDKQYALEQINSRIADAGYRDKVEKLDDETKQLLTDFDAARTLQRYAGLGKTSVPGNTMVSADIAQAEADERVIAIKQALLGTINPNTNKRFTEEEIADYADYLAINKGKQKAAESAEKNAELATEHPVLAAGKRTADVFVGGIGSTFDTLGQAAELAIGNRSNIDVYNPAFQYNRDAQTIDQTIMDNNDFMVGDVDLLDFGYKVATSVADNALRTVAGGGDPTMAAIYMATQGFGQTVQDSVEKGYSPTKAIANGVINAGIEAITEKFSLEKILDQKKAKSIFVALAKSFVAEGSEEVAGDTLSTIMDVVENGNYSEIATQYNELVANGVAPKQALAEVVKNQFGDLVESFLVGGFSGGIMGGGAYVSQFAGNAKSKVANAVGGRASDIRNTNALMAGNANVQAAADLNVDAETNDRYKKALEAYKAVSENATKKETKSAQKELKSAARKVASQLRLSTNEKVTSALKTSLNEELSSANATEEQIKSVEKLVDRKVLTEADNKNIDDLRDSVGADKLQSIFQTANNAARSESAKIQVDAALKADAKTLPNTDDYNKTQNGDTVIHNDNTVEVIGIDAKSGNITLSDKSVVKPSEVEMSEDMADVIEGVKNIGRRFSIESGDLNTIFAYAKSAIGNNTNSVALGLALDDAMMFGYIGQKDLNRSSYIESFGNNPVAMRAINEAYKMAAESSRLAKNIESVKVSKSKKKGTVRYDNVNISEYSEDKQTEAKAVESISSLSPIETVIYDSSKRTDDLTTKNGAFYKDGRLWVDINAEQGVLGAFAHELTHFMREYNEGSFNKIARILISEYGSGKYSAMDAADIARNYANSLKMTVDDAFEEYVADCMTRMLTDSNAAETIAKLRAADAKLADKIASFIRDAVAKIKAALSGTKAKGYSEITKSLDRWQELADLFAEGVAGAMSAYENGAKVESNNKSRASYKGVLAKDADLVALDTAKRMLKEGKSSEEVRKVTGWFKGYDGKWRFEIDDSKMVIIKKTKFNDDLYDDPLFAGLFVPDSRGEERITLYDTDGEYTLDEIIKHDELFEAYPELKDMRVIVSSNITGKNVAGFYNRADNAIHLNRNIYLKEQQIKELLLHELQHWIQNKEGFARGSSPAYWEQKGISEDEYNAFKTSASKEYAGKLSKLPTEDRRKVSRYHELNRQMESILSDIDFYAEGAESKLDEASRIEEESDSLYYELIRTDWFADIDDAYQRMVQTIGDDLYTVFYKNTAGEIEARDVSSRLNMTAEQRKNTRPDIDRTDVVFAENSGISSFSLSSDVSESESKKIIKIINENVSKIANKTIFDVKNVDISNYKHKSDYVLKVFNEHGNQALNPEIGVVELMKSGAKSTMLHGFGKVKIAAVNAIKPVIEKGNIISFEKNYNEKGYDRYVIAGKGIIDEKPAYVGVVINTLTNNANKFYLHEAEIIEAEMHSMTALPLQVDTDSNSTSIGSISNPTEKVNNKFSVKDSEYLELAKNPEKNEARLREMVDEAAKAAMPNTKAIDDNGNPKVVYHGTFFDFNVFDLDKTANANFFGKGFYFTTNESDAINNYATNKGADVKTKIEDLATFYFEEMGHDYEDQYDNEFVSDWNASYDKAEEFYKSGKVLATYLNITNPLYADENGNLVDANGAKKTYSSSEFAIAQGYDGIIDKYVSKRFSNVDSGTTHYIAFNSSQIKSADLVTYDDNGNIIPLSERFNAGNEDIRYSRKGSPIDITAETEYSEILKKLKDTQLVTGKSFKEYAKAKEKSLRHAEYAREKLVKENEQLAEMVRLQRKQTNGKVITPSSINTVAKRIYKEANARGNVDEFAKLLGNLYNGVINGEEITLDMNNSVVDWLVEHHKAADKNADYQAVMKSLRGSKVYLSPSLRTEIEALYGSVAEYSSLINNAIRFTNDETDARFDDVWDELANEFSEFFDGNTTEINQPAVLADVLDALEGSTTELQEYQDSLEDVKMWYLELIYEGYTDVSTLYTVADQYGDKILKLKLAQKKKIAELKKESAARLAEVEKTYKEEKREFAKAKTAEREELRKELVAKYTEMRKRNVEGRSKTVEKNKILRAVKELDTLLNKGNKKRNVKIGMEDLVEKALYMTDVLFSDVKPNQILRGIISGKIQANLAEREKTLLDEYEIIDSRPVSQDDSKAKREKAKDLLAIETQLKELVEREKNAVKNRAYAAMNSFGDAYEELKNSEQSYISDVYNKDIAERIKNFAKEIKGTPVEDLTAAQMHQFYEVIRMVSTTISNANKEFVMGQARDTTELGESTGNELAGGKDTRLGAFDPFKRFFYANMKPVFYFDHIGSKTLKTLFDNVREGEKVFAQDVEEAKKFILDTKAKYGFDDWDLDKVHTFKLTSGQDFKINLNQMMSIYAYSRREQALEHMAFGGFKFADKTMKDTDRKFKPNIRNTSRETFRVNSVDFRKIADSLTEEQKKYVIEMQNYLTQMGKKGNEVSRKLYGIDIFKERVYFPLRTAKEFRKSADTIAANKQLENSGFTKETVPNADNPIILDNFTDVWGEHINQMSLYHSMTLPIRALRRTFEYTGIYSTGKSESVRTIMTNRFDKFATNYLDKFIQDLNGGITTEESSFLSSLFTKMKKSAVAASTSVVIQQPTAIARAMALINPKYFVAPKAATVNVKKNWEEAKRYAPVVIIKEIGGFDTGAGKGVSDWLNSAEYNGFKNKLKGFAKDSQYRDDVLSAGAEIADEVGWSIIWEAVKKETADKTNLTGEDLLKAAGKRFDEVITYTQVYDSVTSRSSFMRSANEVTKMATAFMGEPTTSINLLSYAIIESKRGKITKAHAGRIVAATLSSIVFAAIAKCLPYSLRDDDDDKTFAEKYIDKLTDALFGLGSDIAPWNMVPYLKDLISIWQGYDVDRADITIVSDLVKAIKGLDSTKKSGWVKMENLLGSIGALFGVPVKNLMRTMREIYNLFLAFING